jgi:hypothetical protein
LGLLFENIWIQVKEGNFEILELRQTTLEDNTDVQSHSYLHRQTRQCLFLPPTVTIFVKMREKRLWTFAAAEKQLNQPLAERCETQVFNLFMIFNSS